MLRDIMIFLLLLIFLYMYIFIYKLVLGELMIFINSQATVWCGALFVVKVLLWTAVVTVAAVGPETFVAGLKGLDVDLGGPGRPLVVPLTA